MQQDNNIKMPTTIIKGSTIQGGKIGPVLPTGGLVFFVDAGNPASYSGTGSTWFDLSSSARNMTLYNSPVFTNEGMASYFTFNGTNQYGLASQSGISYVNSTVVYIAYLSATPNDRNTPMSQYANGTGPQFEWAGTAGVAWSAGAGNLGYLRSGYRQNSASSPENDAANGNNQIATTTVYHVTAQWASGGTASHWKNGEFIGSNTNGTQSNPTGSTSVTIGRNNQSGGILYHKGRVYAAMIYSRLLSRDEIQQNFLFFRDRYGI